MSETEITRRRGYAKIIWLVVAVVCFLLAITLAAVNLVTRIAA